MNKSDRHDSAILGDLDAMVGLIRYALIHYDIDSKSDYTRSFPPHKSTNKLISASFQLNELKKIVAPKQNVCLYQSSVVPLQPSLTKCKVAYLADVCVTCRSFNAGIGQTDLSISQGSRPILTPLSTYTYTQQL